MIRRYLSLRTPDYECATVLELPILELAGKYLLIDVDNTLSFAAEQCRRCGGCPISAPDSGGRCNQRHLLGFQRCNTVKA